MLIRNATLQMSATERACMDVRVMNGFNTGKDSAEESCCKQNEEIQYSRKVR